jgi:hypothetical protein
MEGKKIQPEVDREVFFMGLPSHKILKTICVTQICTLPFLLESILFQRYAKGMVMVDPYLMTQTYLSRLFVDYLIDRKYKGYCIQKTKKTRKIIYLELLMAFGVGFFVNYSTTSQIFNFKAMKWKSTQNTLTLWSFVEGFIFRAMAWFPYFYLNFKFQINPENYFLKFIIAIFSYSLASVSWILPEMIVTDRIQIKDITHKYILGEMKYLKPGIILNSVCIVTLDCLNLI